MGLNRLFVLCWTPFVEVMPPLSSLSSTNRCAGLLPPDEQETEALMELMKVLLRDVVGTEGWGFATAWRPQSPDIELVKLVQGGETARIAHSPELVEGHLFFMRRAGTSWVLLELDGPDPGLADRGSDTVVN